MSRRYQGVIVPLDSFIVPVRNRTTEYFNHVAQMWGPSHSGVQRVVDAATFSLIQKLLEDQFLLEVQPRRRNTIVLKVGAIDKYINVIKDSVPEYENLFSACFREHLLGMRFFPDVVFLEQLGDAVVVTWKQE